MFGKKAFACMCLGAAIIGAAAIAQPGDKDKKQPSPEEMKMMEAWQKSMTPGKMHEHLTKGVGTWEGKTTSWMHPDAPPSKSTCTTVITEMMGGRFTRGETKGSFDMGDGNPMAFEGFGLYGYNNTTEKFESTWCDNFGTMMLNFTGTLSDDGKVLTWESGKFKDCMTGADSYMRMTETYKNSDEMTLEMYGPGMDGKETKMMMIEYTRKAKK